MIAYGLGLAVALAPMAHVALADVGTKEETIAVPPPRELPQETVVPQQVPVTAPPPAYVELQRSSVGAGLGISWGKGTLSFEGNNYAFSVKGVSVGDVGLAKMIAEGQVGNLERLSDFAGTYVAVEAAATAGKGVGTTTMMNENGVTITLASKNAGLGLTLGAQGFAISLD